MLKKATPALIGVGIVVAGLLLFNLLSVLVLSNESFTVLGNATVVKSRIVDRLPKGYGFFGGPFVSNRVVAEETEGDGRHLRGGGSFRALVVAYGGRDQSTAKLIQFQSNESIAIDQPVIVRKLKNVLSLPVLDWKCRITGAISRDLKEYYFTPEFSGGGTAGFSIKHELTFNEVGQILRLRVVEQLWYGRATAYDFCFKVSATGALQLQPDGCGLN